MTLDNPVRSLIRVLVLLFLAVPTVPIAIAWVRAVRSPAETAGQRGLRVVLLALVTASQAVVLAGLVSSQVIGPDYSPERYSRIYVSLIAMAITTIAAATALKRGRLLLVTAGAWLTLSWLYILAVSSVV